MTHTTTHEHTHQDAHGDEHGAHHAPTSFLRKYVFSLDHKVIGIQFLFTSLLFLVLGGLLALGVRWQLGFPDQPVPIFGKLFSEDGTIAPEQYNMLFTMHASVMIFFVIIPILTGAFGNFLIPLMIGARDMAFPFLNMASYWLMIPGFIVMLYGFWVEGGAAAAGWTSYPPLSVVGSGTGQTCWLIALLFTGTSSVMGSLNYITTIVKLRAPGMHFFRMPMTVWAMFITAILVLFSTPVLTSALGMELFDRVANTSFFLPSGLTVSGVAQDRSGGGNPLLWQHLFWFYSHPAVYIMILPAMGMVSDVLSAFARKPLFGYRPMVYSVAGIAGLGFIVWGHHMFQSGMNPTLGMTFMVSTMMIALPSAVKVFNWLGTLWRGTIQFTTAMWFAIGFVSMFIIGGLSGIFMAATPVDIFIHDTYFIVGHIHYVLFSGSLFGAFAGVYYWFPKMFGRMMDEKLGKIHWWGTLVFFNCTFFMMHVVGVAGMPRRYADYSKYELWRELLPVNKFMTISAILLGLWQIVFFFNLFKSLLAGPRASENPWKSNTLEWATSSPPPHENFTTIPHVHRGPYEYSVPGMTEDYLPQTAPTPAGAQVAAH